MGSKRSFNDLNRASSAGTSSGDGGGGGGGDATPPSPPRLPMAPPPASPSRDPSAPVASPPPVQPPGPPPRAADEDADEVPDDEEEEPEEEDDYLLEEEDDGDGELDRDQVEAKYDREDLEEGEIEDDADSGEQEGDDKHWGPHDYPRELEFQEPISKLILECSNNDIIQEKIKVLSKQYGLFRKTWIDGSCFYRAFLFSYLENLGQMQDKQAEVLRLMECVEVSIKRFYQLEWKEAYFINPEKYFLSVVYEFYSLVNSVANGLSSDKLYERSLKEMSSGRIICFLRLLTEIEIRTQNINKTYVPEEMIALQFCRKEVRGLYAEAGAVQMRALTYSLGIPLRVEIVDLKKWKDEAVRVKRLDFFRQSDLGKGRVHIVRSYHSSRTAYKPLKRGSDNDLLSPDGAPILTLLCRRGHCDILYPK